MQNSIQLLLVSLGINSRLWYFSWFIHNFASEFTNELNDFNDFKSTLQNLEKTGKEKEAEQQAKQQKVEQKLTNLEEASTMLIDKFNKTGELTKY